MDPQEPTEGWRLMSKRRFLWLVLILPASCVTAYVFKDTSACTKAGSGPASAAPPEAAPSTSDEIDGLAREVRALRVYVEGSR